MDGNSRDDLHDTLNRLKTKALFAIREIWALIVETADLYTEQGCAIRAAGVAYHLLLSIFPLLLFLIFLSSYVLDSTYVRQSLNTYLTATIPAVAPYVEQVVDQTMQARGSFGWIGGLLLVWSASTVFISISSTLNVIWRASHRPFWRRRAVAIVAVLTVGVLFIASVWLSAFTVWPLADRGTALGYWIQFVFDPGLIILFLWFIYRILPNRTVHPRASLVGAVLSGIVWRVARSVFAWFLSTGITDYGLVYGSLASVVILMLWAYLSGVILYLGAAFGSVLEKRYWNPA